VNAKGAEGGASWKWCRSFSPVWYSYSESGALNRIYFILYVTKFKDYGDDAMQCTASSWIHIFGIFSKLWIEYLLYKISSGNAVFLPRDAMHKCSLCLSAGVRLSVRHVRVLYPDGWRYRQTSFSVGSPIILVFLLRMLRPNSKGNPVTGGDKYTSGGKICDFRPKPPFIPETVPDRPMVAMERKRRIDSCRFRSPSL